MMRHSMIIFMTFVLLFGGSSGFAAEAEDYKTEIAFLQQLSLLTEDAEGGFNPEDALSRAEFCVLVTKLLNIDQTFAYTAKKTNFLDVPGSYWASDNISYLHELGAVSGRSDKIFAPDAAVTHGEAVKALLSVMGYQMKCEENGGYPYGYLREAGRLNLTAAAEKGADEPLRKGEAAGLLYQALEIPHFEQPLNGIPGQHGANADQTFLSLHHIQTIEGQIVANEYSGLTVFTPKAKQGCVVLLGKSFQVGETKLAEFLGYCMKLYYRENGLENEVVAYQPQKTSCEFRVNFRDLSEDTLEFPLTQIAYQTDKERYVKIAKGASVLYNGSPVSDWPRREPLGDGELIFIASGNGTQEKIYDVVLIHEYRYGIVNGVDSVNEILYLEDQEPVYLANTDGNCVISGAASLADIQPGFSVKIQQGVHGTPTLIEVLNLELDGMVQEVTEGGRKIKVKDTVYLTTKGFNAEECQPGTTGKFYLTDGGEIFYLDKRFSDAPHYGFILGLAEDGGLSKTVSVKLMQDDGKIAVYDLTDRVSFGAEEVPTNAVKVYEALNTAEEGLICWKLNSEGKIYSIKTAEPGNQEEWNEGGFTLDHTIGTDSEVMFAYSRIDGVLVTSRTKVFVISGEKGNYDEKRSRVTTEYFESGNSYKNVKFYDLSEIGEASAVLVKGNISENFVKGDWPIAVVDGFEKSVDEEGMEVEVLSAYINGGKKSIVISETVNDLSVVPKPLTELKRGDILVYETDDLNQLDRYMICYREGDSEGFLVNYGRGYSGALSNELQVIYGTLDSMNAKGLRVSAGANGKVPFVINSAPTIYVCQEGKKLYTADSSYLISSNPGHNSKVVVHANRNAVMAIVVYQ